MDISTTFALAKRKGAIAQLVEQRTENPCVPGSIPGGTTLREIKLLEIKTVAVVYLLFLLRKSCLISFVKHPHRAHRVTPTF